MQCKSKVLKKLVIVHLFLNLYLLALLGPVFPVLEYLMNYDYISTQLCENKDKPILTCHGKCYLEKQVKASNQLLSHNTDTPTPPKLEQVSFPVFLMQEDFNVPQSVFNQLENSFYTDHQIKTQRYVGSVFRPPKVA